MDMEILEREREVGAMLGKLARNEIFCCSLRGCVGNAELDRIVAYLPGCTFLRSIMSAQAISMFCLLYAYFLLFSFADSVIAIDQHSLDCNKITAGPALASLAAWLATNPAITALV